VSTRRIARLLPIAAAALIFALPAEAHLMNTGFGPFYDGLAHPLLTAEDILPVIAIALLSGLSGTRPARFVIFLLPAAWLLGMAFAAIVAPTASTAWLASLLTIGIGASVAIDRQLTLAAVVSVAVVTGLIHGWTNGAGLGGTGASLTGPLGVACTVFVVTTIVAAFVVSLRAPWMRIVVRVAGSWIAAIGLLMLGWSVRMAGMHT